MKAYLVYDKNFEGVDISFERVPNSIEFELDTLEHDVTFYKVVDNKVVFNESKYIKYQQDMLLDKLTDIYEKLYNDIPKFIDPEITTDVQVKEYRMKYEQAKVGNTAFFEDEAQTLGISAQELMNYVKQLGDRYVAIQNQLIAKLGACRVGIKKLVYANYFDEALAGIRFLKSVNRENASTLTMQDFLNAVTGGKSINEFLKGGSNE